MAIGSGLGSHFGCVAETTYGTSVAPTRFYKVNKAELKKVKTTVQGGGMAAGQFVQDSARRVVTTTAGTASVDVEIGTKGFGLLLAHIFGSSTTPAQQASTTAYLQTHALGDNIGKSLTMQSGVPNRSGTVHPYTLLGSKITSATFACSLDQLLMLSFEADGQALVESTSLASPSYTTGIAPFHFGQMDVKVGTVGSEAHIAGVRGISVQVQRGQDVSGFYAGATVPGTKVEPVMNDWVKITGSLDMDLVNKADIADLYASDTPTSLVIEWVGATIASSYKQTFRLKMPATFFDGDTPVVSGPGVTTGSFPFTVQYDLTNASITAEYMSSDAAI